MSDDAFDAIIVAPNYRLNAFGFLCSKQMLEVANEDGGSCNLNLGFLDQRLAIEWVWRFIQIYGGDRTNMTLAGLSAGRVDQVVLNTSD
jgi:carboxylesterase type B